MGRADLHIHSVASDGVSSVAEILGAAEAAGLDVIAVTDHDRIEAALALQALARAHESEVEIVVGEEVSSRSGHVVALFIEKRIRPWQSLRTTIAQIHEQGGLAIMRPPLVPYPLCASGRTHQRLLRDEDPRHHPDGMEAFNPTTARMRWSTKAPDFAPKSGWPRWPTATRIGPPMSGRLHDLPGSNGRRPARCDPRWRRPTGKARPIPGARRSGRSVPRWPSAARYVRDVRQRAPRSSP
jgi:predicted metal-dependent phosphoesterase TrpH